MSLADQLEALGDAEAWRANAACRGLSPQLMFTERAEGTAQAKALCATCPVKAECLEAGMNEHFGIWGGLSEKQRKKLRNPVRAAVAAHGTISGWDRHKRNHERPCDECREAANAYQRERYARSRECAS